MMELLKSCSTSYLNQNYNESSHLQQDKNCSSYSSLEALPTEVILQILAHLDPISLAKVCQTSQMLRTYANDDLLWARFIRENVPNFTENFTPSPCNSWRELYISHHPYWFVPRNKIWFSDKSNSGSAFTGCLLVARYDWRRACIEAYRLVAEPGAQNIGEWGIDLNIAIRSFNPKVQLWLDDPVVKLDLKKDTGQNGYQQEVPMQTTLMGTIRTTISLCKRISKTMQRRSMTLWPPAILPASERVLIESMSRLGDQSIFRGLEHRPKSLSEASDKAFRIRKRLEYQGLGSLFEIVGEDVITFSTLREDYYTPTKRKPWQGIWVGDYGGHGCEFLVILQKDVISDQNSGIVSESAGQVPNIDPTLSEADRHLREQTHSSELKVDLPLSEGGVELEDGSSIGRLEAIKLTGDSNVPRGEYTWIAEDIGPKGLIRIVDGQNFAGARIVRSVGHIADRGFQDDRYIASQLIMISHDSLAQYWEDLGHVSSYVRVNINNYIHI